MNLNIYFLVLSAHLNTKKEKVTGGHSTFHLSTTLAAHFLFHFKIQVRLQEEL